MVDPFAPDLDRYPRFAEAWSHASEATLEPGDALYLPYMWWHGVESLEPVSILVNYWWTDHDPALGAPYDALLHNLLRSEERRVGQAGVSTVGSRGAPSH